MTTDLPIEASHDTKATAAESLLGITLPGGWKVIERIPPRPGATGGYFSVGYIVEDADGKRGFLKALDFAKVLSDDSENGEEHDLLRALEEVTKTYNFERDLLAKCKNLRMSRVATAISDGSVTVKNFEPLHRVYFLIFELAKGDARSHLDDAGTLEVIWCFRTLRQVATGLQQLHLKHIAHQDLKPSNVLDFEEHGARVGDLGRACERGNMGPNDDFEIAGDKGYAPPELLYGFRPPDWSMRRLGCDAYLLGSLTYFFFARTSMTAAVMTRLQPSHTHLAWGGTFAEVLPQLRSAFDEVLREFEGLLTELMKAELAREVLAIVRQLCEPDPNLRGYPMTRGNSQVQFSMDRYISKFNLLANRAEILGIK